VLVTPVSGNGHKRQCIFLRGPTRLTQSVDRTEEDGSFDVLGEKIDLGGRSRLLWFVLGICAARVRSAELETEMRFMILVKATKDSEAGKMPSPQLLADMGKFNQELIAAGVMLDGGGLHPTSKGARVIFSGKERTVTKGPFAHVNELVSGYWIWKLNSLEEAIDWVKRCPNPMLETSDVEIRQFYEVEDFASSTAKT